MYAFVPIYKQKLYILKIELFLGIHTVLWNKKSALKCFKCYSEKRLHSFGNRLKIGTTIIIINRTKVAPNLMDVDFHHTVKIFCTKTYVKAVQQALLYI